MPIIAFRGYLALMLGALVALSVPTLSFGAAEAATYEPTRPAHLRREANIYKRPPGKSYDFRECSMDPQSIERRFCRAVGIVFCDGQITGVATVLDVPERRGQIILVAAHSFKTEDNRDFQNCKFYTSDRKTAGTPITNWHLLNEEPNAPDIKGRPGRFDIGVAVLARSVLDRSGAVPYRPLSNDELRYELSVGAQFFLIGYHPDNDRISVSDRCGPLPAERHFFDAHVQEEFKHNCNSVPGFSGGPLVMVRGGQAAVVCVHTSELNYKSHRRGDPFDPRKSANAFIQISSEVEKLIGRAAKSSSATTHR